MVSNPKKLFNKKFSRFESNNSCRGDNGGINLKNGDSNFLKVKKEGYKMYQKEEDKKEKEVIWRLNV